MKYVKLDDLIPVVRGRPFHLARGINSDVPVPQATFLEAIYGVLIDYQANPAERHVLSNQENRYRRRCLDLLETGPQEKGLYRFEDAEYAVVVKVIDWMGPYLEQPEYIQDLEDRLASATDKPSEDSPKLKVVTDT